ncbi:MAG TPA: cell division protein SepF [Mycobacteriales bacterium]|jgi:cell division inhibitor SepF|nr:cell division protein SepF [Mycobacteriales bacterium]HVX68999.1 cell division protein SepF [Mycobacteriales bacterium]
MAGAMRKMAVYLGLVEDEDLDGEYDDDGFDQRDHVVRRSEEPVLRVTRPDERADRAARPARPEPVDALDAYRITTVHPRNYNEARVIGEHFRDGTPVIMNLTDMEDTDAKRLVDFAAGLVFGRHGSIERVTQKVFLLTPANVEITAEDKSRLAGAGFFNQS